MKFALAIAFFLCMILPSQAQYWPAPGHNIRVIHMNGKQGLSRSYYPNLLALPIYDEISWLSKSSFLVKKGNYYGILDTLGNEKIKPDRYTNFAQREDLEDGEKLIILYIYNYTSVVQNILADLNGNTLARNFYEFKEKNGDLMIVTVTSADSIQRALFFKEGEYDQLFKYGILKVDGTWLLKPEDREFSFVNDHCISATKPSRKMSLLNLQGNQIINDENLSYCYDRLIYDSLKILNQFCVQNDLHYWFIDSKGTLVAKVPRSSPNLRAVLDSTNKKYGGKLEGKWVIPAQYDNIYISGHYAMAYDKTKNTTDLYDKSGKLLSATKYNSIYSPQYISQYRRSDPAKELLFGQTENGQFLLNEKFKPVSENLNEVFSIIYTTQSTSLFSFKSKDNLYGVMNQKGKLIIPPVYDNVPHEENKLLIVKASKVIGFDVLDLSGKAIFKDVNAISSSSLNPNFCYGTKAGVQTVYSLIDSKVIIPSGTYNSFSEIPKYGLVIASKDEKKFMLDKNFKLLSTTSFSVLNQDRGNPILTTLSGKKQMFDINRHKFSEEYDEIYSPPYYFPDSLNKKNMVRKGRKYGLVDNTGLIRISCKWDTILFSGKKAILKSGKKYSFTDTNYVINKKISSDSIQQFDGGANTLFRSNNKWYSLEYPSAEFECDQILAFANSNFVTLKKNEKQGVYSLKNNKWYLPAIFDSIITCSNEYSTSNPIYLAQKDGKKYFIDSLKNTLSERSFDFIEPIYLMLHAAKSSMRNFLVNEGGKKSTSITRGAKTNTVTGGKFGISNAKGELLHAMNGDHVVALIDKNYVYYEGSENEVNQVLGFLWNMGGTVEDYVCFGQDSATQEVFDKNGNSYYVKVGRDLAYDKKISGGKFGVIDANGKEMLPIIYDKIIFMYTNAERSEDYRKNYSEYYYREPSDRLSLFPVFLKKENKWGAADLSGKLIIPIDYDSIADYTFGNEKMIQVWKNGQYGFFDLFGKPLLSAEFTGELDFTTQENQENYNNFVILQKGGSIKVDYYVRKMEQEQYTETGEVITIRMNDTIRHNYFTGGQLGIFEPDSYKTLLAPEYDDIRFLQVVRDSSNESNDQRISVTQKTKWRLIFKASEFKPYFEIKKSGKWGVYRFQEGIIIKPQYEDIEIMYPLIPLEDNNPYGSNEWEKMAAAMGIKCKQTGKWGVLDMRGKIILKPEYTSIRVVDNHYEAIKNGLRSYFDAEGKPTDENGNAR